MELGELKTIVASIESDVLNIPEEIREILGHDLKIVVGTAAIIAFSAGTSYADVLRSLELIRDDIQLRSSEEASEKSRPKIPK